jgi:hypothetical protein
MPLKDVEKFEPYRSDGSHRVAVGDPLHDRYHVHKLDFWPLLTHGKDGTDFSTSESYFGTLSSIRYLKGSRPSPVAIGASGLALTLNVFLAISQPSRLVCTAFSTLSG